METEIANVEWIACGTAVILIGIWGLWVALLIALGYQAAPRWLRWSLVTAIAALASQIVLSEIAPDDWSIDLTLPGTVSLLTLCVGVAVTHGICRLTASQARGPASGSLT